VHRAIDACLPIAQHISEVTGGQHEGIGAWVREKGGVKDNGLADVSLNW